MGSSDSKLNFRKAVIQLTTKTQVYMCASVEQIITNRAQERTAEHPRVDEQAAPK